MIRLEQTPAEFARTAVSTIPGEDYSLATAIRDKFTEKILNVITALINECYDGTPLYGIMDDLRRRIEQLCNYALIVVSQSERNVRPVGDKKDGVYAGEIKVRAQAVLSRSESLDKLEGPKLLAHAMFAQRLEEFRTSFAQRLEENMAALQLRIAQSEGELAGKRKHLRELYANQVSGDPAQLHSEREELEGKTIPRLKSSLAQEEDRLTRRRNFVCTLDKWQLRSYLQRRCNGESAKEQIQIVREFINSFQEFLGAQQQYLTMCKLKDSVPEFNAQALLRELFEDDVVISTPLEAARTRADLLQEDRRLRRTKRITLAVGISIAAALLGGAFVARYISNRNAQHAQDSSNLLHP